MVADHSLFLQLGQPRRVAILIGLTGAKHLIDFHQQVVRYGDQGRSFLTSRAADNPPELLLEITVFDRGCGPGTLGQGAA